MTQIDHRQAVMRLLAKEGKPLSADALCAGLRVKKKARASLQITQGKMEKEGALLRSKKGKYAAGETGCVRGRILSLSKGFAFARLEAEGEDCFIPGKDLNGALPGDTVRLRLDRSDPRGPQGTVVRVEEEGPRMYSGRILAGENGRLLVEADASIRYPLPVRKSATGGAVCGEKVRFTVQWKGPRAAASVQTIYGNADSARICADAIIDSRGIPARFPPPVWEEAEYQRRRGITPKDREEREDFREKCLFTIDGRDAKDLDDAVSLEKEGDGWLLGVHIADVSHYVEKDSLLDEEAFRRGTSVYFADRVIPMLPEALSNGVCSLNPGEDKLAFSALLSFDGDGVYRQCRLVKSVIRSQLRGVYDEVNDWFGGAPSRETAAKYAPVGEMLTQMRRLAARLREAAEQRGTMDLMSSETQFILDENGAPVSVFPRAMGEAEGMIEQFMIAANVAVAEWARWRQIPFIYRVHEQPDPEKLAELTAVATNLGFKTAVRLDGASPASLRAVMEEARDTPYARLISDRLLRSMAKAAYSDNPLGHYGLALRDYCHFTSPIRRYPDLAIHRILADGLANTPKAAMAGRYGDFVRAAADAASACEVRAMSAERDCEDCYKAEYMAGFLGSVFDGIVASVSDFGIFVELPNTVTGLIRLEALPGEGLRFDGTATIVDRAGRRLFTVGDRMAVQVAACDVSAGQVAFLPAENQ